jgi:hypothetical protein
MSHPAGSNSPLQKVEVVVVVPVVAVVVVTVVVLVEVTEVVVVDTVVVVLDTVVVVVEIVVVVLVRLVVVDVIEVVVLDTVVVVLLAVEVVVVDTVVVVVLMVEVVGQLSHVAGHNFLSGVASNSPENEVPSEMSSHQPPMTPFSATTSARPWGCSTEVLALSAQYGGSNNDVSISPGNVWSQDLVVVVVMVVVEEVSTQDPHITGQFARAPRRTTSRGESQMVVLVQYVLGRSNLPLQ